MTASIERLPVEVFDIIALDLNLLAHQQLRLASRQLHSLSLSTFTKRYFTEITTTLGSPSLDRLVNVSSHGYFRNAVSLLSVKLLNHRDYKVLTSICDVGKFPPPKRFPNVPGVKVAHISGEATLYNDVVHGDYTRCVTDRLTRSLRSLNKLKTIRFCALRNESAHWERYGMSNGNQVFRTKCFQAVIDSIIKSEIQLEEFSMAKRKKPSTLRKRADVPCAALRFTLSSLASLQHSFFHLQSLTLTLVSAPDDNLRTPGWESDTSQLVTCAPNLKNLTLSLDCGSKISHQSAAIIHSLAKSCRISALESLHLVNCSLHETDLARFVAEHRHTLCVLIINNVQQLSGSWSSFWSSLKAAVNLRYLRLGILSVGSVPVMIYWRKEMRIEFKLDTASAGRTMCDMLDQLIAAYDGVLESSPVGHDVTD
jgi:hypothetical protein